MALYSVCHSTIYDSTEVLVSCPDYFHRARKMRSGHETTEVHALSDFQPLNSHVQGQFVKEHVTTPLESLLALFQDPLHLMHKRRDKLLDYDHMQYALEHAEEPEKIKQL